MLALVGATAGYSYISNNEAEIIEKISEYMVEYEVPVMITKDFELPDGLVYIIAAQIALSAALSAYLFKSSSRLFGFVVKDETPFTQKVVKSLKSMGIAFFVYTGVKFILGATVYPAVGSVIKIGLIILNINTFYLVYCY